MIARAGSPNLDALARQAMQKLPRFEGKPAGDLDPSKLEGSERRQVIAEVAKQARLHPGDVAEQLLAQWGGATEAKGKAAEGLLDAGGLHQRSAGLGGNAPVQGHGVFGGLGIALAVKGALGQASPLEGTRWQNVGASYKPEHVDTPAYVLAADRTKVKGGWADPEQVPRAQLEERLTHTNGGKLLFNAEGKPLNPAGPTGKAGRLLGKWGPNHAADPVIIRHNPQTGVPEMLAIQRKDTKQWAIPGGMVDDGERISSTLARELEEETGVKLNMGSAIPVYQGVVSADPRNTDNAWMETNVCVKVLTDTEASKLQPKADDDAMNVQWMPMTESNLGGLYANHGEFARMALDVMADRDVAQRRAGKSEAVDALSPELQGLPEPLKKLCAEIDGLWGNADGKVSVEELDRVAKFTLQALPFFTEEASAIIELAEALGFADNANVGQLKSGLKEIDPADAKERQAFRAILDEAIAASDKKGPELIRDIAQHQPRWHRLSILEHTAAAVAGVREMAKEAGLDWPAAGAIMLLHDVGKILERAEWKDESTGASGWHFGDHEDIGARWLEHKGLDPDFIFHVRHHGDIRKGAMQDVIDLCKGDKRLMQEFVVVTLADTLAKGDTDALKQSFEEGIRPRIEELCRHCGLDPDKMVQAYLSRRDAWYG